MNERNFFLKKNGRSLYCVENLPNPGKDRQSGIILCKPIWGERIRTGRIFVNLARMLARQGYSVTSCDYFGDGNSGGDTFDLCFEGMVEDIRMLHSDFRSRIHMREVCLIGMLIGANVAVEVERSIPDLKKMILFEPIMNPIDTFKRALRANLSSQMVKYKKIVRDREALIQDLRNDIPVNIDGFLIGKHFWESFERNTPLRVDSDFKGTVSVYALTEKGKSPANYQMIAEAYKNGKFSSIEKEFIWTDWKYYIPNPPVFFEAIKNNL